MATRSKKRISSEPDPGDPMSGCNILRESLIKQDVEYIFGYPGGASLEIHQAVDQSDEAMMTPDV